jgi:adenylate cyclase
VGTARLDYTAHGSAVNTAARLEAMNKDFGTSILLGPGARAALPERAFRTLGLVEVRGRGPVEVFAPVSDRGADEG